MERRPVGQPARYQVAELPATAVIRSEHRLQRLRCPQCGRATRAELPPEVPAGAFGPRLQAAVASLAVRNRVSRRDTTELLAELFGAQLSVGSSTPSCSTPPRPWVNPTRTSSSTCAPPRPSTSRKTGWRLRGGKRTLWGALTGRAAVFRSAEGRHRREAQALLGEDFSGVACSDRWWALRLPRCGTMPVLLGTLVLEHEDAAKRMSAATGLSGEEVDDIIDYLCSVAHHQQIYFLWRPVLRDPGDDHVLELAVEAGCELVVTFNVRDFAGSERFSVTAVTPGEFLRRIGGSA